MQFKNLNKIVGNIKFLKIKFTFSNQKRYVRRNPSNSLDNKQPEIKNDEKAIKILKKEVDLKSYSSSISTAVKSALENDPSILKSSNDQSLINEKGKIELKSLDFSFDSEKYKHLLENDSSDIQNKRIKSSPIISMEDFDLEQDQNHPKSKVNCGGCGSKLHCQDKNKPGFIDARKFKTLTKKELLFTVCFRCEFFQTKKKLLNLNTNKFDYEKYILDKICAQPKAHVILLIDLLNIPNSIYHGWSKLINLNQFEKNDQDNKQININQNNIDICILGNKYDLLPNTGPLFEKSIIECLASHCAQMGIKGNQIKHVDLISAKTGYNIERVISKFFKLWNDEGNVYLLGMANAGKSVFFNQLLSSDYCRSLASDAIVRATTSFWPGTTLNNIKFPITFLTPRKELARKYRLLKDRELLENLDSKRKERYEKDHNLKDAEVIGIVGCSFKKYSVASDEVNVEVDSTYSIDQNTGLVIEGESFSNTNQIKKKREEEARTIYRPEFYKDKAAWFYDTPGILDSQEILTNFSKQELEIVTPLGLIMPRIYWMKPDQTLFVGGLMRVDLLESTNDERVLFSIMASPALPIVNPITTEQADSTYENYYEKGNVLRVPHKHHIREKQLPPLESKNFEISCVGNFKSTADIVFSCFGWMSVTSRPDVTAKIRAFTLGGEGLTLRKPSLLPFIVNLRRQWDRKDGSQSFKAVYYKKPKIL